jgi:hypothetical protein
MSISGIFENSGSPEFSPVASFFSTIFITIL